MRAGHDVSGRVGAGIVVWWIRRNLEHDVLFRCDAATPSLLNEGVAAVRRLADRGKEESRRAQGRPTHSHHQMQVWNTCLTDTRTTFKYHGLLIPITGNQ